MRYILFFLAFLKSLLAQDGVCWRDAYIRVGTPANQCADGLEQSGLLCYPKCNDGFYGVGPVCWEICPSGYTDIGVSCNINMHIYGKGCCCFFNSCCNKCPAGYKDDGCTCRRPPVIKFKKSYGRGFGVPIGCKSGQNIAGLCYQPCREGYTGLGLFCWTKCQNSFPSDCLTMCANNSTVCSAQLQNLASFGLNLANLFSQPDISIIPALIERFNIPSC